MSSRKGIGVYTPALTIDDFFTTIISLQNI
jgi:hypothetical protein